MPEKSTSRRSRFTIWHGVAASLLLHAAPAAPFVWYGLATPPDNAPPLMVELQGTIADNQTEEKVQQEIRGAAAEQDKPERTKPAQAPPSEAAEKQPVDHQDAPPPPAPQPTEQKPQPPAAAKSAGTGANTITGAVERQIAQTIIQPDRPTEIELLREYVKLLSRKVQDHLVYPDDSRRAALQGTATVSFAILPSGQVRPETLKIVTSSGQPQLDASALKTIRASIPFDPAPKEMTVIIAVDFGRKR